MKKISTVDTKGKQVHITEADFQKAIIKYLREASPNRAKIIAETQNSTGTPEIIPVAICVLAKNPSEVIHYTDVLPLEKSEKEEGDKKPSIEIINDPSGGDMGGMKSVALVTNFEPLQIQLTNDYDSSYINLYLPEVETLIHHLVAWVGSKKK